MKRILSYCLCALLLLGSVSCRHKARVIPRGVMVKIYAECFLIDQQIERQRLNRLADTTFVYGAILDKYGYTVEDYWFSQNKYIKDANRYTRMLKRSVAILEKERKELQRQKKLKDEKENAEKYRRIYLPHRIYLLDTLKMDRLMEFDIQEGLDTIWRGPLMVVPADSLLHKADSLLHKADSLSQHTDSSEDAEI